MTGTLIKASAYAAVVLGLALGSARADTVVNLSTGLDASGNLQTTGGALDAHWFTSGANNPLNAPNAYVVAPGSGDWPSNWVSNGPTSSWIAANPNDSTGNGTVTYWTTFNVANPAQASILNAAWTMDDSGTISINGHDLASLGNVYEGSLWSVAIPSSDLVAGLNTLQITSTWADNNFEGARFQGLLCSGSASCGSVNVPGPVAGAGLPALIMGIGLLGYRARRKYKFV